MDETYDRLHRERAELIAALHKLVEAAEPINDYRQDEDLDNALADARALLTAHDAAEQARKDALDRLAADGQEMMGEEY